MDFLRWRNRIRVALWSDRRFLQRQYRKAFGFPPDLDDPKRWTEILTWMKLHDRDPLYTVCSDKIAVRKYVSERLGDDVLIPLLATGQGWSDIDYAALEEPFIIKTSHGSGGNRIVRDISEVDESELRRKLSRRLKRNHYHRWREWQYKDIKPRLLVERLLVDDDDRTPADYKFHCFNYGDEIEVIILVVTDRNEDPRAAYFDESWSYLGYRLVHRPPDTPPARPPFMADLIATAKTLASEFAYVRVDLYWVDGQVYFGELTFTPASGLSPVSPDEWDFILGEKLRKTGILEKAGTSS